MEHRHNFNQVNVIDDAVPDVIRKSFSLDVAKLPVRNPGKDRALPNDLHGSVKLRLEPLNLMRCGGKIPINRAIVLFVRQTRKDQLEAHALFFASAIFARVRSLMVSHGTRCSG